MKFANKFSTAQELEQAYLALQAEFTRRCQELSQLRQDLSPAPDPVQTPTEQPQTEQTPHGQEAGDAEREACVAFFAAYPGARSCTDAICHTLAASNAPIDELALLRAYVVALDGMLAAQSPERLAGDEAFLAAYIYPSAAVRAHFARELNADQPPAPRIVKARGATILPPVRPTSIAEAGALAHDFFKENKQW